MTLIKCSDCGKHISENALSCPHCGCQSLDVETNEMIKCVEERQDESVKQIQISFNRIHDKLFSINGVFIAAYLVLATYPSDSPVIQLWTAVFPVGNLFFLIALEIRQMEIHRFATNEMDWLKKQRDRYGRMIQSQTLLSLLSIMTTIAVVAFIGYKIYCYQYG